MYKNSNVLWPNPLLHSTTLKSKWSNKTITVLFAHFASPTHFFADNYFSCRRNNELSYTTKFCVYARMYIIFIVLLFDKSRQKCTLRNSLSIQFITQVGTTLWMSPVDGIFIHTHFPTQCENNKAKKVSSTLNKYTFVHCGNIIWRARKRLFLVDCFIEFIFCLIFVASY